MMKTTQKAIKQAAAVDLTHARFEELQELAP